MFSDVGAAFTETSPNTKKCCEQCSEHKMSLGADAALPISFKPSKLKMNEQLKTQCNNFLPLLEYKDYIMSLLSKLKQKGKNNTKREALLTTNEIF